MKYENLEFIDGTFNASDATHLLLSLINYKIEFHTTQKWSHAERYGRDHDHSIQRLHELEQLRASLRDICKQASDKGISLKIKGTLSIEPVTTPESTSPDKS